MTSTTAKSLEESTGLLSTATFFWVGAFLKSAGKEVEDGSFDLSSLPRPPDLDAEPNPVPLGCVICSVATATATARTAAATNSNKHRQQ
eukprot:TRINITY_DN6641_c3_g1_i1.p1 TRINITY_DN6641_c3_g1~~TRINITY_DN6641_c3_g1_i1.p1  ORF type:complete len:104 (-),score=19.86 TRINITY_DN6641_c3_g1_i1:28-294(-)